MKSILLYILITISSLAVGTAGMITKARCTRILSLEYESNDVGLRNCAIITFLVEGIHALC